MADNERADAGTQEANDDQYDPTIPTPDEAAVNDQDPNPRSGDLPDAPVAGEQPAADGALDEHGVPLRADGTQARDKGEVS